MTPGRVLITGAGSGLGRALALRCAAAGWRVCAADIRPERAAETVAQLGPGEHMAVAVDVGDDASMEALATAVAARWDGLELLVNNAGVASGGGLLSADLAQWRWMLEINLLGVVRGCRAFLPALRRARRAHVLNVASFAGLAGAPNIMSYGVAKAGVVAFSEQLRAELHGSGIGVSVLCPAFFRTNLAENYRGDPRMKEVACRLMAESSTDADAVAAAALAGVARDTFLILPTAAERWRWRLKRFLPETYFRALLRMTGRRGALPLAE